MDAETIYNVSKNEIQKLMDINMKINLFSYLLIINKLTTSTSLFIFT